MIYSGPHTSSKQYRYHPLTAAEATGAYSRKSLIMKDYETHWSILALTVFLHGFECVYMHDLTMNYLIPDQTTGEVSAHFC